MPSLREWMLRNVRRNTLPPTCHTIPCAGLGAERHVCFMFGLCATESRTRAVSPIVSALFRFLSSPHEIVVSAACDYC